ncbi:MAG: aminopeptidase [Firmicutes bacterium]|nr:aminopeptidase [Bacillota bacterium]
MDKKLQMYAELIVKQGLNLEKGEMLAISADIECAPLADAVAEFAYKAGACRVVMFWGSPKQGKLAYQYQSDETLREVPDYVVASRDYLIEKKAAYLGIASELPDFLSDVDPEKIKISTIASSIALKRFRESTGSNKTRWCLCAYPNETWAKKVFPGLTAEKALGKMWDYVYKTLRMDTPDPLTAWKKHEHDLERRSVILNDAGIESLTFKNSLGTDFEVWLPEGYVFSGAAEKSFYGRAFTANLPTEEVFCSPDYRKAEGKVVSSLPLVRRGAIIKNFWFEFKGGAVVDFGAEDGYETLKGIIESDEGARYLGEVALVGYNSPIQNLKTLFYCTLFDENASCHLAVGRGFGACLKGGLEMTKDELKERGINDSLEHVDFMIGTPDLSVVAKKRGGGNMVIFKDGDWTF